MEVFKVKVDAKDVLTDIRSGMTDAVLMEKYGLSAKGLKSLFDKLGTMGLMHRLDAREVLNDLKSGMTDAELMNKYQLSQNALRNLFAEIDRVHLSKNAARPDDKLDEIESKFHEIAEAMRSGVSKAELMRTYRLTEKGVEWVSSVLACESAAGGTDENQNKSSKQEEPAAGTPDAANGPLIDVPAPAEPHPLMSQDSFGDAPKVGREGCGMKAFFIGGMILWLLVDLIYFGLMDQSSTEAMYFIVFGIGAVIAVITAGLYLGFRWWFSHRGRIEP